MHRAGETVEDNLRLEAHGIKEQDLCPHLVDRYQTAHAVHICHRSAPHSPLAVRCGFKTRPFITIAGIAVSGGGVQPADTQNRCARQHHPVLVLLRQE